jgi:hypothetical protein
MPPIDMDVSIVDPQAILGMAINAPLIDWGERYALQEQRS